MKNKIPDMVCFSSIELSDPIISKNHVNAEVLLTRNDTEQSCFELNLKYDGELSEKIIPLLRMAFIMPLLNYGLFTKNIILHFPISIADKALLDNLNIVFSRDIFVNKILRRRTNYILPEFLPDQEKVVTTDAEPKASIVSSDKYLDYVIASEFDTKKCGILSSGGKESLLTYGLLKEIGCKPYPFYINESGGHWRTALPAYKYHTCIDEETQRVWTNVDRFYVFMLDNLLFIRKDHRLIWADTYPIRLCIFPFYVFVLLPLFVERNIGNLLIGSEFDDIRSTPEYLGMRHYYGVYDQHQDYDHLMNNWYKKRLQGLVQWSAVRTISGLVEERILVKRYPNLAEQQRSCHSCHFENNEIIPCGSCSKCIGVLLFLLANDLDPKIMKFKQKDIDLFSNRIEASPLRLDEDEKLQSFFLLSNKYPQLTGKFVDHVEKIHLNKETIDLALIPDHIRDNLLTILQKYTTGFCELKDETWVSVNKHEISD